MPKTKRLANPVTSRALGPLQGYQSLNASARCTALSLLELGGPSTPPPGRPHTVRSFIEGGPHLVVSGAPAAGRPEEDLVSMELCGVRR